MTPIGAVGHDRLGEREKRRLQPRQQLVPNCALLCIGALQSVTERYQCGEKLIGGLQTDDAMSRLFAGTATRSLNVRDRLTRCLDRCARTTQVRMGVCVPRGFIRVACLKQSPEIFRCRCQG